MIYTITLNPAIDKAVVIDNFRINEVNRISHIQQDPGGKGINVSNMIKKLRGESVAIIVVGGHTGEILVDMLEAMEIDYKDIPCYGETRINVKVFDSELKTYTDLNEPGPMIEQEALDDIEAFLETNLSADDIVTLAGSIPKGVPEDIYGRWITLANRKEAKVILDASGQALKASMETAPFLIKPNQEELEDYFGVTFKNDKEVVKYARKLIHKGIKYVVVSQGVDGCLLISKEQGAKILPVKVSVKSTVGAGDSMVGAIAKNLEEIFSGAEELDFKTMIDTVAYGVAASSASIEQAGTIMGDFRRVNEIYASVKTLTLQ